MVWEPRQGYAALDVKDRDTEDDEAVPFRLVLLCDMIKETEKQREGVELVKERPNE